MFDQGNNRFMGRDTPLYNIRSQSLNENQMVDWYVSEARQHKVESQPHIPDSQTGIPHGSCHMVK